MASSERESSPPSLEELSTRGATAFLLPWIISMAAATNSAARDILVFVHQPTRSITLMEAEGSLDAETLYDLAAKEAPLPASKASIESLPRVLVSDPGLECPICLTEYDLNVDVEAKEMPCKHRFHSGCIEKWLAIHGSCPVCRFVMPAAAEEKKGSEERERWRVHVFFARGRTGSDSGQIGESDLSSGSGHYGSDEMSTQDMEMDDIN